MLLRTESLPLRHSFTLERGLERTQVPEFYNVAIGNNIACDFGGIVQYGFYFLTVECGRLCHTLAETAEVHTMSARRASYLVDLSCLRTDT